MSDEEGDFPTTEDGLAASTKRLADWTFSLQGVGTDLKALMNEFKTYWRSLTPVSADGTTMAALIPEAKLPALSSGVRVRQGANTLTVTEHSRLLPWLMMCSMVSGIAIAVALGTFFYLHDQMLRDQRSFEQMRIQVLSQNAILQREGFVKPGDEWMGPEGNLQFNPNLQRRK